MYPWMYHLKTSLFRKVRDAFKESYKHLNAEFQRIARRDKKAFLSDQCKEIASPGSIHDTGCLGLVHWDDPEGGYGEGGGFRMGNTCIPVVDSF